MRTFRGRHDDAPSRAGVRAVLLLAIGVVLLVAPQVAAASTTLDVRGTYVGTSNANGNDYSGGAVITTEDCATGAFSGYGYKDGQAYSTITGTVTGDISNNSETSYEVYTYVNYSATGAGTYSLDGQGRLVLTGTFSDTNGASGTAQSVRVDGPTDGLCGGSYTTSTTSTSSSSSSSSSTLRPSAMQVSCDYYFATTAYVCTAQVGDASGQQPPGIPGGTVTFSPLPGATGVFAQQKQCTLMPSQTGGASSYCSVTYSPTAPLRLNTQPAITAHYSGDVNFQPTDASPQNIYATTTSISTDTTSATSTSQPTTTSTSGTTTSSSVTTSASSSRTSSTTSSSSSSTSSGTCSGASHAQDAPGTSGVGRGYRKALQTRDASVPMSQRGIQFCLASTFHSFTIRGVQVAGDIIAGGVGAVVGVAVPVGATVLGAQAGPVGGAAGFGLGALTSYTYILPATGATISFIDQAADKAAADPPNPHYKVIAVPKIPRVASLAAGHGVTRSAARALTNLVREQAQAYGVSAALAATLDRAGGAAKAGNRGWIGRQTRTEIVYAKRLISILDRLVVLQRAASHAAHADAALRKPLVSTSTLGRRLKSAARRGFNSSETRFLSRTLGLTRGQIRALRVKLGKVKPSAVPRSADAVLGSRDTILVYQYFAAAFRAFIKAPSILIAAKL